MLRATASVRDREAVQWQSMSTFCQFQGSSLVQATAELYDEEGFQRTGDVCEQQGPDIFVWIDRVSNIIKLSQGEYVSVSRLEALYAANSPSVHQMYLYGNSLRAYLVAIVVAQQGDIITFLHALDEFLGTGPRTCSVLSRSKVSSSHPSTHQMTFFAMAHAPARYCCEDATSGRPNDIRTQQQPRRLHGVRCCLQRSRYRSYAR